MQTCQLSKMAGAKILRSLSLFLVVALISYFSESAFTGSLTAAGLTFTIPTLSTLTQTQLIYLTAGGLSKSQHLPQPLCIICLPSVQVWVRLLV